MLNTESLTEPPAATIEQDAQFNDNSDVFVEASGRRHEAAMRSLSFGGLGGFDVTAIGSRPGGTWSWGSRRLVSALADQRRSRRRSVKDSAVAATGSRQENAGQRWRHCGFGTSGRRRR